MKRLLANEVENSRLNRCNCIDKNIPELYAYGSIRDACFYIRCPSCNKKTRSYHKEIYGALREWNIITCGEETEYTSKDITHIAHNISKSAAKLIFNQIEYYLKRMRDD